jgi:hypothetical protein
VKMIYGRVDENKNVVPAEPGTTSNDRIAIYYHGDMFVSTVFLGVNHGFDEEDLWFETMVFQKDNWEELYCERYATWDAAERGHQDVVNRLVSGTLLNERS